MLVVFCLRLSLGLLASLCLLSPTLINPRFYRTHFLTVLGLLAVPAVLLWSTAPGWLLGLVGSAMFACYVGSVLWSLEHAPAGKTIVGLTVLLLLTLMLSYTRWLSHAESTPQLAWLWAGDLTSAALLGLVTTAMLMGHSYLVAPTMSLSPLLRLLAGTALIAGLRMLLAGWALSLWWLGNTPSEHAWFWLPVRWGLGFVGPLVLVWMAWQAARIRSTQSATGILYVAVIFCFLGELTSQLLLQATRFAL